MGLISDLTEVDRVKRILRQTSPLADVLPLPVNRSIVPLPDKPTSIDGVVPLKDMVYEKSSSNPMNGFGGVLGMLMGIGGGILANSVRADQERVASAKQMEQMMRSKTVQPSFYAGKGGVVGGEGAMPVQAKKGEVAVLPNMMIVDVHADNKKHEGMGKKITDILPGGTYIGGDKVISREMADKVELGHDVSEYSEFEKGKPVETIKLSSLYGNKKKMTVAELLRATRSKFKVPEGLEDNNTYDPFARETAKANMAQREKYVSAIMGLHMGKKSLIEQLKMMENAR